MVKAARVAIRDLSGTVMPVFWTGSFLFGQAKISMKNFFFFLGGGGVITNHLLGYS